jgi:serine acetyltransferase
MYTSTQSASPDKVSPALRPPGQTRLERLQASAAHLVESVREDRALIHRQGVKYAGKPDRPESLPAALVQKVGLQMMAAYRLMRFCAGAEIPLAPRMISRLIRHAYGSDIHWDADLAPGVMIVHGMGMAVSHAARVGRRVVLSHNVTLGLGTHPDTREIGGPTIEDDVVIGPGVTVLGPVRIGARSKIMPGCLVVRSVPPDSLVEAFMPAVRPRGAPRGAR